MKLLKTYNNTGAHDGYFDHAKNTSYRLYPWRKSLPGHVRETFLVRVNFPCVDGDGDEVGAFLSPEFATREEAMAELDRIAALIEGKHEPRWGVGIDLASGPDSAVDVVIDRATGKIVSVKDAAAPAQGWVAGAPPQDGKWYVVNYGWSESLVGVARWNQPRDCFCDDAGTDYRNFTIYHHLPTPIQPPQES